MITKELGERVAAAIMLENAHLTCTASRRAECMRTALLAIRIRAEDAGTREMFR